MKVEVTLTYQDKTYVFVEDFGTLKYPETDQESEYPFEAAEFTFTDGNYGCDCNRSLMLRKHCGYDFPEMKCGDKIKLLRLVDLQTGETVNYE